jgi:membrane protein YdbS with pleckstrin-like domain
VSEVASPTASASPHADSGEPGARLREPAHHVAPEAVSYWAVRSLTGALIQWVVITGVYVFVLPEDWKLWAGPVAVLLVAISIVELAVVPRWRYRVHRWEVTDTAIYTRSGWLTREQRIAPLSRVQTVDSERGPLMRFFRLSSITVTTASAAGPITIDCLNDDVAARVVADLTEITARTEGDAT